MDYPYRVQAIVWVDANGKLPTEATVLLCKLLVQSGPEDCEPDGLHEYLDGLDEDEVDEFWQNYKPSAAACIAWDAEWDSAIKERLEALHGAKVASFGDCGPEPHVNLRDAE